MSVFFLGSALPSFAAKDLNIKNDTESFLFVSGTTGNVGIGTAVPVSELDIKAGLSASPKIISVDGTFADLTTTKTGLYVDVTASVAGNRGATGTWSEIRTTADSGTYTYAIAGVYGEVLHSGAATADFLMGSIGLVNNMGSGNITNAYGFYPQIWKGAGDISHAYGMYYQGVPDVNGDTGTDLGGDVINQYGIGIRRLTEATTRNIGILLDDTTEGAATAGNFSIYEETGYPNYFTGNIGVGTTSPEAKLALHSTGTTLVDSHVNEDTTGAGTVESHYAVGRSGEARATPSDVQNFRFFFGGFDQEVARISMNTPSMAGATAIGAMDVYTQGAAGTLVRGMTLDEHKAMFAPNVGIGTSEPEAKLHVGDTGSGPDAMPITGSDVYIEGNLEIDGKIYGDGSGLTGISGAIMGLTATRVPVAFDSTTLVDSVIYEVGGNIGIGVATPAAKLDVQGGNLAVVSGDIILESSSMPSTRDSVRIYETDQSKGSVEIFRDGESNIKLAADWITGGHSYINAGNVGIGTTVPAKKLHVAGEIGVNAGQGIFLDADAGAAAQNAFVYSNVGTSRIEFVAGGSERMSLTTAGNLGLGTMTPAARLHIGDEGSAPNAMSITGMDAYIEGNLEVDGSIYGGSIHAVSNAATANVNYATTPGSLYVQQDLEVDGNVYLGDLITDSLIVAGSLTLSGSTNYAGPVSISTTDTTAFVVRQQAGGAQVFNVDTQSGNVGVGTSAPRALLEVGTGATIPVGSSPAGILDGNLVVDGTVYATLFLGSLELGMTTGSVVFEGPAGLTEDNANFFWDDTNNRLGIGTSAPPVRLAVGAGTPDAMPVTGDDVYVRGNLEVDGKIYGDGSELTGVNSIFGLNEGYIPRAGSSTTIVDSVIYQNVNTNVGIGTTEPSQKLELASPRAVMKIQEIGTSDRSATMGFADGFNFVFDVSGGGGVRFADDLQPTTDALRSLGAASLRWAALYTAGVTIGTTVAIGTTAPAADLHIGIGGSNLGADLSSESALIKGNLEVDGKIYGDGSGLTGISGAISGLTATRVPVASSGTTLVDSIIYEVGGNVGVGTASPRQALDIPGSLVVGTTKFTTYSSEIRVTDNADTYNRLLRISDVFASTPMAALGNSAGLASTWTFLDHNSLYTANTDNFIIKNSALDSDVATFNMHLSAQDAYSSAVTNLSGGDVYVYGGSSVGAGVNGDVILAHNGTTSMGNVGIGTITPVSKLHVGDAGSAPSVMSITGMDAYIEGNLEVDGKIYGDGSALTGLPSGIGGLMATRVPVALNATTLVDSVIYDVGGNIGIGSAAPLAKLDVIVTDDRPLLSLRAHPNGVPVITVDHWGQLVAEHGFRISAAAGYDGNAILDVRSASVGHIPFSVVGIAGQTGNLVNITSDGGPAGNLFNILSNGNVGIGTINPSARLSVDGINQGVSVGQGVLSNGHTASLTLYGYDNGAQHSLMIRSTYSADNLRSEELVTGAGSQRFLVDTTLTNANILLLSGLGNIGIGTSVPVAKLHVGDTGSVPDAMNITGNDAYIEGNLEVDGIIYGNGAGITGISGAISGLTATRLPVASSGTTLVDSIIYEVGGNIGIGAAAPIDSLQIVGWSGSDKGLTIGNGTEDVPRIHLIDNNGINAYFAANITNGGNAAWVSTDATLLRFYTNNAGDEQLVLNSNGNIGIGTFAPLAKLHIGEDSSPDAMGITGMDAYIEGNLEVDGIIYGNGAGITGISGAISGLTATRLPVASDSTTIVDSVIYDVGGNIGIGTSAPISNLHVAGSALSGAWMGLFVQNGITPEDSVTGTPTHNKMISVQGDDGAYFMGRDVTNNIEFVFGTSTLGEAFAGAMTSHDMSFRTNNSDRLTIKASTGRVGIGTRTPAGLLDVDSHFTVLSTGNVGIATTNPLALLSIGAGTPDAMNITGNDAYVVGNLEVDGKIYGDGSALTGLPSGISGLTATRVPVALNATTLVDSIIYEVEGNVGVGVSAPTQTLEVAGGVTLSGDLAVNNDQLYVNTATGNVGFGMTDPNNRIQVFELIDFNNAEQNTRLGYNAGQNVVAGAGNNTFVGYRAGRSNTTGSTDAANFNTVVGADSLLYNTTGSKNVILGYAAASVQGGEQDLTVVNNGIFIGANVWAKADNSTNEIVIGSDQLGLGSNTVKLGNSSIVTTMLNGNVGIGTWSPVAALSVGMGAPNAMPVSGGDDAYVGGNLEVDGKIYGDGSGLTGISGAISGLTATRIPVASNSTTLVDSIIYEVGGNIGLGISIPAEKLDVAGKIKLSSGVATDTIYSDNSEGLVLESQGNLYGTTRLTLQNISGSNGTLFENLGVDVIDFGFKPSVGGQQNIRVEHRAALIYSGNTAGQFEFGPADAEYWFVGQATSGLRTGNFGIGTTSPPTALAVGLGIPDAMPITGSDLYVRGNIEFDGRIYGDGSALTGLPSGIGGLTATRMPVASSPTTIVDSNIYTIGNTLGIGTTNPTAPLEIFTPDDITAIKVTQDGGSRVFSISNSGMIFSTTGTYGDTVWGAVGQLEVYNQLAGRVGLYVEGFGATQSGDLLQLSNNSTLLFNVDKNGNVGIGTSLPVAALSVGVGMPDAMPVAGGDDIYVAGNLEVDGKIYGDGSELTGIASSQWTTTGNDIYYDDGNVGITTTVPTAKLDIQTNAIADAQSDADGLVLKNTTPSTAGVTSQYSPGIVFSGGAWSSNNTVNVPTKWRVFNLNTSIGGQPQVSSSLVFQSSEDGAAYNTIMSVDDATNGATVLTVNGWIDASYFDSTDTGATILRTQGNSAGHALTVSTGTTFNYTSGTGGSILSDIDYAPGSGTGVFNVFTYSGEIDQDGGANGITRGIYLNPTLTSAYDWRALEIANNSGFGIYQSGAGAVNYLNGNVGIGTYAPMDKLDILNGNIVFSGPDNGVQKSILWRSSDGAVTGAFIRADPGYSSVSMEIGDFGGVQIYIDSNNNDTNRSFSIHNNVATGNTNELFRVQEDGNVGIGTAVPRARLEVGAAAVIPSGSSPAEVVKGDLVVDGKIYGDGSALTGISGSGITDLTDNYIVRANGSTAIENSIIYDDGANIGIGTASPKAQLNIKNNATVPFQITNDTDGDYLTVTSAGYVGVGVRNPLGVLNIADRSGTATQFFIESYNHFSGPQIVGRTARGTYDSPSATQSGDYLLFFGGRGYGTTSWSTVANVGVWGVAAQTFTDTAKGTYMMFYTTPIGSITRAERFRIADSGNIGINNSTPRAKLDIIGTGATSATSALIIRNSSSVANVAVRDDGNVGIGTVAPAARLHISNDTSTPNIMPITGSDLYVKGNVEFDGKIYGDGSALTGIAAGLSGLTDNYIVRALGTDNVENSIIYDNTTNVGISTTAPLAKLDLVGAGATSATASLIIRDSSRAAKITILDNGNVGIGTVAPSARMETVGQYFSRRYAATTTINWANGNVQYLQLASGANVVTFTGAQPGGRYLLEVQQPSGGAAGTITWDANVQWPNAAAPTLTTTNSQTDIVTFYYNGTNYAGAASLNYAL